MITLPTTLIIQTPMLCPVLTGLRASWAFNWGISSYCLIFCKVTCNLIATRLETKNFSHQRGESVTMKRQAVGTYLSTMIPTWNSISNSDPGRIPLWFPLRQTLWQGFHGYLAHWWHFSPGKHFSYFIANRRELKWKQAHTQPLEMNTDKLYQHAKWWKAGQLCQSSMTLEKRALNVGFPFISVVSCTCHMSITSPWYETCMGRRQMWWVWVRVNDLWLK